jgi:hypothetical protein
MAADDLMGEIGHLASVGADRFLGLADRQLDRTRLDAALLQARHVRGHACGVARGAVREIDYGHAAIFAGGLKL